MGCDHFGPPPHARFPIAFLLAALCQVAQSQQIEYVWKEAGFAARMPGTAVPGRGGITLDDYKLTSKVGDDSYMLVYEPMSGKYVDDAKWQFDRIRDNFMAIYIRDRPNTAVDETDIVVEMNPGREIRFRNKVQKRLVVLRTYWVKSRLRLLSAMASTTDDSNAEVRIAAFLSRNDGLVSRVIRLTKGRVIADPDPEPPRYRNK